MSSTHSCFSRPRRSPIPRLAPVMLAALLLLAWSSLALSGEIHNAARDGDLGRVEALLRDDPDLVFSKDNLRDAFAVGGGLWPQGRGGIAACQ